MVGLNFEDPYDNESISGISIGVKDFNSSVVLGGANGLNAY